MSQSEMAGKLGVRPQTWSGWEAGVSEPSLETIQKIATALKTEAAWLAFGVRTMEDERIDVPAPVKRKKAR